jgi:hypothetical protein
MINLRLDTRATYFYAFSTHFSIEKNLGLLRKRLGRRPNFGVDGAFYTIDGTNIGYLTTNDLQQLLVEQASKLPLKNSIYVSTDTIGTRTEESPTQSSWERCYLSRWLKTDEG